MTAPDPVSSDFPQAVLRPRRRLSLLWLLPLIATIISAWLLYSAHSQRGAAITVEFRQGHGLEEGNDLRYRGIIVGTVQDIRLADTLDRIQVVVRLHREAEDLAREGSRFWIVRPQVNLTRVAGLDTVIGANYLGVLPGQGPSQRRFVGLEEPPLLEILEPGGLEIVLTTPHKGNLRQGAPVSYRQVAVGTILEVDLARDASTVEAQVYIKPDYVSLIRENTRFWKTGGARFSAGFTGLSLDVDSVHSLILGGITLALPPDPGKQVPPGHSFNLHEEPERAWLEWIPSLPLFDTASAADRLRPRPLAATLSWQYKNLLRLTRKTSRRAWVLPVEGGLLGPADVLTVPDNALPDSVRLVLHDMKIVPTATQVQANGVAYLPLNHEYAAWDRIRSTSRPEPTLVIASPDAPVRYIGANRYRVQDGHWKVDAALPFTRDWHGASVIAESDGALVGLLLVEDEEARVAVLNASLIAKWNIE